MVSISERPASVEDRAVPGHWEGDLLSGSKNSTIATLVERQTRYVMLVKVANKETQTVVSALIRQAGKLPTELYKSLTHNGHQWQPDQPLPITVPGMSLRVHKVGAGCDFTVDRRSVTAR